MPMNHVTLANLPEWLQNETKRIGEYFETDASRMAYAIELSHRNVAQASGGPFGAALFEADTGELVAVGTNLVVRSRCSHAHAEMVAIAMAQQRLGHYDLAAEGNFVLYSSSEPCAMCAGAIPWSGVVRVVTGALDADVRAIGFDEGSKPEAWAEALRERGIEVTEGVQREAAVGVLKGYAALGGTIY